MLAPRGLAGRPDAPASGWRGARRFLLQRSPMPRRRQKIWITRAQPAADITAERVRALGHEALVAPLLAVRPLPDVEVDLSGVAALAFTSANGVRAFADLSGERSLRGFALGAAPPPA